MFSRIQIAHSDFDVRFAIAGALEEIAQEFVEVDGMPGQVTNQEQARAALQRVSPPIGLVVLDIDLPAQAGSPKDRYGAIPFLEELKQRRPQPAVLVVADEVTPVLRHLGEGFERFDLLLLRGAGDDAFEQLHTAVTRWRKEGTPRAEPQRVVASLDLYPRASSVSYIARFFGGGEKPREDWGEIPIRDSTTYEQLAEDMETFDYNHESFFKILQRHGRAVFDLIFAEDCRYAYERAIGFCGLERVHIRFHLERQLYPMLFEAAFDRTKDRGFLMARAPMVRCVKTSDRTLGLRPFDLYRRQQVHILLILSDVDEDHHVVALPEFKPPTFATLRNLTVERDHLLDLQDKDERLRVEVIEAGENDDAGGFAKRIESVLRDGTSWDVVHFAGHSWFTMGPFEPSGFLVLRRNRSTADLLPVAEFARWLRDAGTQLTYLSSCKSSSAAIAYELAENGVPSSLGFRWAVDDDKAATFARSFYEEALKSGITLAEAFRLARWKMYVVQDRFCAAPMLVLQPDDWIGVAAA